VTGDVVVIANLVSRVAPQIVAEATEATVELLEHNGLGLNFADLLSDDP
jgi:hypothetical protein